MSMDPFVVAWADQRIAEAGEFLTVLVADQRNDMARTGRSAADAASVNGLSAYLDHRITGEFRPIGSAGSRYPTVGGEVKTQEQHPEWDMVIARLLVLLARVEAKGK